MLSKKRVYIILIILVVIALVGCAKDEEESKEQSQIDKSPTSLDNINLTMDEIISDLEKMHSDFKKEAEKKEISEKINKEKQEEKSSSSDVEKKADKILKGWQELSDKIQKLHRDWNKYESEESASQDQIDFIEKRLNNLTESIEDKRIVDSLLEVNQFNLGIADLYSIYNLKIKSNLRKIKAYTRDIIYLNYREGKDEEKKINIEKIKALLPQLEAQTKDDERLKESFIGLEEGVNDLEEVVDLQLNKAIEVKGRLILQKIKELEAR